MKLAWKPRKTIILFVVFAVLSCQLSPTSAQTIENYDPTQEYSVHSVSKGDPAPEAGASGIPRNEDDQSNTAFETVQNSQQSQVVSSSSVLDRVSAAFSQVGQVFINGVRTVGSGMVWFAGDVWGRMTTHFFRDVSSFYQVLDLASDGLTYLQTRASLVPEAFWQLAGGLTLGTGAGVMLAFPFGRSLLFGAAQSGLSVVASVADFVLHVGSGAAAVTQSLFYGTTFAASYKTAKTWLRNKTGRDIGSFTQDLVVSSLVVVTGVALMYGSVIVAGGSRVVASIGSWLSGPTGTYFVFRNQQAAMETTQECQNPGQCNSFTDFGITYGFNLAFAGIPDFEADRGVMSAKNQALQKVGRGGDEVVEEVIIPVSQDAKLNNIINNLYKGVRNPKRVGTGTTADAIRHELSTGLPTQGRFHSQKGRESIRALEKWLNNNPDASAEDVEIATDLLEDLKNALEGK